MTAASGALVLALMVVAPPEHAPEDPRGESAEQVPPDWVTEVEDWDDAPHRQDEGAPAEKTRETKETKETKAPDPPKKRRETGFAKAATGSVQLVGAYMRFPDVPSVFPASDDGLVTGVARFVVDQKVSDHLRWELNVFGDLSRSPPALLAGAFASAGSTRSAYRTPTATFTFWNRGSVNGRIGVDRFALGVDKGRISLTIGRFPLNYSTASIFTPNDFFSPFSATAVNTVYKPGVDAVRLGVGIGKLSSLDLVGVMGWDGLGIPSWRHTAVLARAGVVLWGIEWSALGGKLAERWVVGAGLQGDVGPIGLRGEMHVGFPDDEGDGRLDTDRRKPYVRVAAGPNVNFSWQNVTLAAEYAFYRDGAKKPENYLQRASQLYPDDLPYLGRHYVGLVAGIEIIPILRLALVGLLDAGDQSGLAGLSLSYNIADEADFVAGLFVPWGRKPSEGSVDGLGVPPLDSEFGLSPLTVYLQTQFFF